MKMACLHLFPFYSTLLSALASNYPLSGEFFVSVKYIKLGMEDAEQHILQQPSLRNYIAASNTRTTATTLKPISGNMDQTNVPNNTVAHLASALVHLSNALVHVVTSQTHPNDTVNGVCHPANTTACLTNTMTCLTNTMACLANMVGHPADSVDVDYELTHYKVFRAQVPRAGNHGARHEIYVETKLAGAFFPGYKFEVDGPRSKLTFNDAGCMHPFLSSLHAKIWHVGWVAKEGFVDRIRTVCVAVPLPDPDLQLCCCHQWTDRAIDALFAARVLKPLRGCGNAAVIKPNEAQQRREEDV